MKSFTPLSSQCVVVSVPITLKKRGGLKQILAPDGAPVVVDSNHDGALLKAVARAFRWRKMLELGEYTTLAELAAAEKINPSYVSRVLRLTLLSPDIIDAVLDGRQPATLSLAKALKPFHANWGKQKNELTRTTRQSEGSERLSVNPNSFDRITHMGGKSLFVQTPRKGQPGNAY